MSNNRGILSSSYCVLSRNSNIATEERTRRIQRSSKSDQRDGGSQPVYGAWTDESSIWSKILYTSPHEERFYGEGCWRVIKVCAFVETASHVVERSPTP